MTTRTCSFLLAPLALAAAAVAQGPDFLLTYSQPELTLSGSGGGQLRFLYPNEIAHLEWSNGPCSSLSAEKWAPRTCFHTMAGDEDFDTWWFEPTMMGSIDALMTGASTTPVGGLANARTVFYSPSVPLGTAVSGAPGLRPGDVGRIVRDAAFVEGQIEYFVRREQINLAMGLPLNTPIDVDAIAWAQGIGVFFSLDLDTPAMLGCGPAFVQDGAILTIPDWAITWSANQTVAAVLPNTAEVVFTEAQVDAMVWNAQLTDRFGNCIPNAIDTEALEIDWSGPIQSNPGCTGVVIQVPTLIFSTETMTGAGLCTTQGFGTIYNGLCGAAARGCGGGPTFGPQMGIQATSTTLGAPSYINSIASTFAYRYVMEPQQHIVNVPAAGLPVGSQMVDISSPWPFNFVFWTPAAFAPGTATQSFPNFLGVPLTFPDFYPNPNFWTWTGGGFNNWPMVPVPGGFVGKVVFQSLAFPPGGSWELSTPITVEFF